MTMIYEPTDLCYLCGKQLATEEVNEDHLFQQQFLIRPQPKARGFDYAGILPVHKQCNSVFGNAGQGPESLCRKALQLLDVLHSQDAHWKVRKDNPTFKIVAINSTSLPDFTQQDIKFFKLIDVRNVPYQDWASGPHLTDKPKVNPFHISINVALSTLAKSTAGFLVKRYKYPREGKWRILAIPHYAQDLDFSFDDLFGNAKPLEVGIKLWIKQEYNGWITAYQNVRFVVFLCFEPSASDYFQKVKDLFPNVSCLLYDSDKLIDLVDYDWSNNIYPL